MDFSTARFMCFLSSTDLDRTRAFFSDKLGLNLISSDEYAIEYRLNETRLRVNKVAEISPAAYTMLGWEVDDITATVNTMCGRGIDFIKYEHMPQDESGICTFPGNNKVAWFNDPDKNVLSLTQFK